MMRAVLALAALTLVACSSTIGGRPPTPSPPASSDSSALIIAANWPSPNNDLTPGSVVKGCTYPRPVTQRDVTAATKAAVKAAYRYTGPSGIDHVEYDHRVPFALCGGNGPNNIWPETYDGAPTSTYVHNYKDQLEDVVIGLVRHHHLTLLQGQWVFYGDWRIAWCEYVHKPGVVC